MSKEAARKMDNYTQETTEATETARTPDIRDEMAHVAKIYRRAEEKRTSELIRSYRSMMRLMFGIIAVLALAIIAVAVGWTHEQGTIVPQIETVEVIKEVEVPEYIAIDPSNEYSHELSDDSFLLTDSNYGPIWMPALKDVPKNEYIPELFVKDDETGYISYTDPDEPGYMGIDVSVYQGDIDWEAVKAAGVDFAIIRCGYRGYVTGLVAEDANFRKNIAGAKEAGIKVGIYFFSQALTVDEALEEAEMCIDALGDYELELPVFYDWEVVIDKDGDTPRTAYIEPDTLTNNALVFAERIRLAGFEPGIYANRKTAVWKYDLSRLDGIDIWMAEYSDAPTYFYDFDIWQYSSDGRVPGIDADVDLNISFKDYSVEE